MGQGSNGFRENSSAGGWWFGGWGHFLLQFGCWQGVVLGGWVGTAALCLNGLGSGDGG